MTAPFHYKISMVMDVSDITARAVIVEYHIYYYDPRFLVICVVMQSTKPLCYQRHILKNDGNRRYYSNDIAVTHLYHFINVLLYHDVIMFQTLKK